MTPDRDSYVRKLLTTAVPAPDPAPHEDWNAVLERAGATPGVPRSRRLVWLGRAGAAVAVATAIFAAILLDRGRERVRAYVLRQEQVKRFELAAGGAEAEA